MKLFQHDKKVWNNGETDRTWQFGVINNRSLLWVNYENPSSLVHSKLWVHYENPSRLVFSDGGLHILFSFFTNSLFGVDFQVGKVGLSFNLLSDYFEGWDE